MNDWIDKCLIAALCVLGAISLVLLAWLFAMIPKMIFAQEVCLAHGYPNGRIDYKLNAYCVKRVNQTDFVVPLADVAGAK